jgi:hypothetical protein
MVPVLLLSIVVLVAGSASAFANDTLAELATGGLVFTKSDQIEMLSEDLFVSMDQVRVRYRFVNKSDRDIVTHAAFPMPDIPYDTDDFNFVIPGNDPEKIIPFSTTANGQPVAALVERKALLAGVDQTEILQRLGVPIAPSFDQKLDYLPEQTRKELISRGLIKDIDHDRHIEPRWTLKTTYYWQQTFPARQEILIDHRYQPSVGGGGVPMSAQDLLNHPGDLQIDHTKGTNRFCIDQSFLNAMVRPRNITWEQHFLEYILLTGANWSGPIKNFRLVVDKGSPDTLVSFCGRGVQKIGPTQFEVRVVDFIPTSNLSVLILTPAHPQPAESQSVLPSLNGQANLDPSLSCDQLWHQRNSIFKSAGYCFHTPRAIRVFGNAGCAYDNQFNVPLSERDRQVVEAIVRFERTKGCPR